jgi:hypothetical protein
MKASGLMARDTEKESGYFLMVMSAKNIMENGSKIIEKAREL